MSCNCKKAKNIIQGHLVNVFENITKKQIDDKTVKMRLAICEQCEYKTYMDMRDFMKNILNETLPIQKKGKYAFCSICKCSINAKAKVSDERCAINKW